MNNLQVFTNSEFGKIRTMAIDGEPWVVGKDVAEILGYANPNEAIHEHIDDEDKLNSKTLSSFTLDLGQRGGWLINESGLYSLILSSKLPKAKQFKRWVTSEVLPTLRKTGGYVSDDDLFINTYLKFADEHTKAMFKSTLKTVKQLNSKIEEDRPKVLFANAVETAS